jgi:hypothetical protein
LTEIPWQGLDTACQHLLSIKAVRSMLLQILVVNNVDKSQYLDGTVLSLSTVAGHRKKIKQLECFKVNLSMYDNRSVMTLRSFNRGLLKRDAVWSGT